jgi:hypothetical protein
MSWLTDLRHGIGQATADESAGLLTYRTPAEGVYVPGELGIYATITPPNPDDVVTMTTYVIEQGVETIVGVQFKLRASKVATLDSVEDALTNSWSKRQNGSLNGVTVIQSQFASGTSLGQDANGRILRSVNYRVTANRPLRLDT